MSEKLRIRGAEYFLEMISGFERHYGKPSNLFLVEFYSGTLDQEDDDFGTWAFLCRAFEDCLSADPADTGPPGTQTIPTQNEPHVGARCILGALVGSICRTIRSAIYAADRVVDCPLRSCHLAGLAWA